MSWTEWKSPIHCASWETPTIGFDVVGAPPPCLGKKRPQFLTQHRWVPLTLCAMCAYRLLLACRLFRTGWVRRLPRPIMAKVGYPFPEIPPCSESPPSRSGRNFASSRVGVHTRGKAMVSRIRIHCLASVKMSQSAKRAVPERRQNSIEVQRPASRGRGIFLWRKGAADVWAAVTGVRSVLAIPKSADGKLAPAPSGRPPIVPTWGAWGTR